jgi:energy-coupling factor transporter ATP-binding protein EcfA2
MLLTSVTVQFFRNFVEPQTVRIEDDLTVFVGKNESGKTTILKALHRLNPANPENALFDLRTDYPRWRLAPDRRRNPRILDLDPVTAEFRLDAADCLHLADFLPAPPPVGTTCTASRSYANAGRLELRADLGSVVAGVAASAGVGGPDLALLLAGTSLDEVTATATTRAAELAAAPDDGPRAEALGAFAAAIADHAYLLDGARLTEAARAAVWGRLPRFFYFSDYENLPGECDLTKLAAKIARKAAISPRERTVVALLAHAGEEPKDFLDDDYDSRKAELQAASADLSGRAFEYWGQNRDLSVVFDTDNVRVEAKSGDVMHRLLKIQLRDGRHGDVETNFETRSSGFRWFFSFFAAFSEFQDTDEQLIVLLDEPGTSLHGDAQTDFVRFVSGELARSKQTLYTTHSQHMVDPTRYEKLRAVHDRATRENPDLAVVVTAVDLTADRDTLLPIEAALSYAVSQHLNACPGQHLAVAEISDLIYLTRMTERAGREADDGGLNPRLSVMPVGGAGNMPAFVALMGRQRPLSALVDGSRTGAGWPRLAAAAETNGVPLTSLVVCGDADASLPGDADLEDLFAQGDYLRLYNWAFGTAIAAKDVASTPAPIRRRIEDVLGPFDRAWPAHALTEHRREFFAAVDPRTVDRFRKLFALLNATLRPSGSPRPALADELAALADPRRSVSARENRRVGR